MEFGLSRKYVEGGCWSRHVYGWEGQRGALLKGTVKSAKLSVCAVSGCCTLTVPPAAVGVHRLRRPSNDIGLSPRLLPRSAYTLFTKYTRKPLAANSGRPRKVKANKTRLLLTAFPSCRGRVAIATY